MLTKLWRVCLAIALLLRGSQGYVHMSFNACSMNFDNYASVPNSYNEKAKKLMSKVASTVIGPVAVGAFANKVSAATATKMSALTEDAYTDLGGMRISRILNGMWQVSGAHGFEPMKEKVVSEMAHYADEGFCTFDLADIYGNAEDYVGFFRKGSLSSSNARDCQFFTKWVPSPEVMTKQIVDNAINRSLRRMKVDQIDLLQFHWWDYTNKYYYDAVNFLMALKEKEVIKNLGLTNFDTKHMVDLIDEGAPIISNQVSFSVLDTRPLEKMVPSNVETGVKLLCYGTLLGGFLSKSWLGRPEPSPESLTNVSLRKYLPWISYWGGWELFQEMLGVLDKVGDKHGVSLSNVALRWVLDQKTVAGVIVGARFGYSEHLEDNHRVFSFSLDEDDYKRISAVQQKSRSLMTVFGDCGGEYRRRSTWDA